jgi:enamine deaminase RidA (YjgF/YER057c/UK114 family)
MKREHYLSGTTWEPFVGYARAVKVANTIHVSGTTATDASGKLVGTDDVYAQTVQSIRNIQEALAHFDATLEHVVRTRMYVTNISRDWESIGRAHGEFFNEIRPATSMVEVSALIDPHMLVEIEADAVIIK